MLAELKRRREEDEGFTLIELMVVVLIIAILVAIAVPTFLGARERAQDRSAQSSARNALTAGRILFTDEGDFGVPADIATNLAAIEAGLTFGAASTTASEVGAAATDADGTNGADYVIYTVLSDTGTCFGIRDWSGNDSTPANAGHGQTMYAAGSVATCNPAGVDGLNAWAAEW